MAKPRVQSRTVEVASPAAANPVVLINARGVARLRAGHVWIYRSDIKEPGDVPAGAIVDLQDERGRPHGSAFYSTSSVIALRLLSARTIPAAEWIAQVLPARIVAAVTFRRNVVHASDAFRVIFSEADALPGLIVDRYNDVLSLQVLTQGFDREDVREVVLRTLTAELAPRVIVERVDARIRELEQLPARGDAVIWPKHGTAGLAAASTTFTLNGLKFRFDAARGQKTGAFLDQRDNYAVVERYTHGEALDCFCYQGGFALHLARKCSAVTGVDSSRPALELAESNAELNRDSLQVPNIEWIEANAFDLLRDYAAAGRQYDTIVLDPPAFAKSRNALPTALRGYKELNLRSLKMLRPGGILATCSCSYQVNEADFLEMLASAAADAHRTVRILERRGAGPDHPYVVTIPETNYLKCVICQVA